MACPLFYSILVLTLFLSHDMIVLIYAGVAELADALDLGSSVPDVQVQVLSPAVVFKKSNLVKDSAFLLRFLLIFF